MKIDEEIDYDIFILNEHFRMCEYAGAIEEQSWVKIKDALEKQNAKKPICKEQRENQWQIDTWHECPACQEEIYQTDYCPGCGQKIDWSDGDED